MDSQPRKQRRAYELWLKKNDPAKYREWKADSQTRGRQIHAENVEKVRQSESEYYENLQTKMINDMRNDGFSDSEIDEHVEDWTKRIKVWGSEERPMRNREIRKSKLSSDQILPYTDLDEE
jgi:hypothetical protein